MLDTHVSFRSEDLADGRVLISLNTQTNIPGQEFDTAIFMQPRDWEALQASASHMAQQTAQRVRMASIAPAHIRDAYLTFALMNPQYNAARAFDADKFAQGSPIFEAALDTACAHEAQSRWQIAGAMQQTYLRQKSWAARASATAPDTRSR